MMRALQDDVLTWIKEKRRALLVAGHVLEQDAVRRALDVDDERAEEPVGDVDVRYAPLCEPMPVSV